LSSKKDDTINQVTSNDDQYVIHTFGGNGKGKNCKFPFVYDGGTFYECTTLKRDKPWCSVTKSYDKVPLWGFCDDKHPLLRHESKSEALSLAGLVKAHRQNMMHKQGEELVSTQSGIKTYGGNAKGSFCVFPFLYDGETYMKCIPRSGGSSWCAVSHSYDSHPIWGNCCKGIDCPVI